MAQQRTLWERVQDAARAALSAWRGSTGAQLTRELFYDGLSPAQRKRAEKYALLWRYYRGEHKRPLKRKQGMPDDNVIINHSRRIVDKGVAFLFGHELGMELQEGETTDAERRLRDIWRANGDMAWLHDLALNGAVCGTFYVQIVPREGRLPKLVNLDPGIVFPEWNPQDVDEAWAYQLRYSNGDRVQRDIYTLAEDGETWVFWREELRRGEGWLEIRERQEWPWPWSPILHGKNLPNPNSFYGLSDLEDADINDAINFVASNVNRILRLHSHPVVFGYGVGGGDLDVAPDRGIIAKNPDAFLRYLEMSSNLGSSHEYLRRLTADYYKTAKVPEMDPDTVSLGAQSGFALKVLFADLMEKTLVKRRLYGRVLVELNRRLLEMEGLGDANVATLHWQNPLPEDERSDIAALAFDRDSGLVSVETMAAKRGYDWQNEQQRMADQLAAASVAEKAQAILALTNAGASLGSAARVAGLSEEQAARLLEVDVGGIEQ